MEHHVLAELKEKGGGFMPGFSTGIPKVKEVLISTKKRNEKKLEMRLKLRSFT